MRRVYVCGFHSYLRLEVSLELYKQNQAFFRVCTRNHSNSHVLVSMDPSPPASPAICDINQGAGINAANHVLVGLTIIVVAVRFAVRFWIVKDIRWDDWTILLALVSKICSPVCVGWRKTD